MFPDDLTEIGMKRNVYGEAWEKQAVGWPVYGEGKEIDSVGVNVLSR